MGRTLTSNRCHPEVINTIMSGFIGRIAVTYVDWAGPVSQVVTVPWRIIDGKDSAGTFADILADEAIAFIRETSISGGIEFATGLFDDNGIAENPRYGCTMVVSMFLRCFAEAAQGLT